MMVGDIGIDRRLKDFLASSDEHLPQTINNFTILVSLTRCGVSVSATAFPRRDVVIYLYVSQQKESTESVFQILTQPH